MTLYFTCPTAALVPAAVKPSHPGFGLFRHYRNYDAGINLFVVDGAVTTVEPDYEFVTPERVYLGGHIHTVTEAEAAVLTAAGYTVIESVPVAPSAPLPGFEDVYGDTVLSPGEFGYGEYGAGGYGGEVNPGLPGFEDTPSTGNDVDEGLVTTGLGVIPLGTYYLGGQ